VYRLNIAGIERYIDLRYIYIFITLDDFATLSDQSITVISDKLRVVVRGDSSRGRMNRRHLYRSTVTFNGHILIV
jgi:hypothetical protein